MIVISYILGANSDFMRYVTLKFFIISVKQIRYRTRSHTFSAENPGRISMRDREAGNTFIPGRITKEQAKDTGMAMVLISLIGAYFSQADYYIILSIIFLLFCMTIPGIYAPLAKVWLGFSNILGSVMSKVVLTLLFFLLVTPTGLIRKLFNPDPLRIREWGRDKSSVFRVRDVTFEPEDIEKPY